jgi:hypothetical protein
VLDPIVGGRRAGCSAPDIEGCSADLADSPIAPPVVDRDAREAI